MINELFFSLHLLNIHSYRRAHAHELEQTRRLKVRSVTVIEVNLCKQEKRLVCIQNEADSSVFQQLLS